MKTITWDAQIEKTKLSIIVYEQAFTINTSFQNGEQTQPRYVIRVKEVTI